MTHTTQHYWNALALTQRHQKVSRAAQDRFAPKSCPLSRSATIHEVLACWDISSPTGGFPSPSFSV